ncbi:MAG: hypothetical protein ISR89_09040 [Candidatus Marinimicrobia bacterium]|nr:hypothetical protein [Candidatus Neomarinimicrobiota bacterium]
MKKPVLLLRVESSFRRADPMEHNKYYWCRNTKAGPGYGINEFTISGITELGGIRRDTRLNRRAGNCFVGSSQCHM